MGVAEPDMVLVGEMEGVTVVVPLALYVAVKLGLTVDVEERLAVALLVLVAV